jgi:hypothetical protein
MLNSYEILKWLKVYTWFYFLFVIILSFFYFILKAFGYNNPILIEILVSSATQLKFLLPASILILILLIVQTFSSHKITKYQFLQSLQNLVLVEFMFIIISNIVSFLR